MTRRFVLLLAAVALLSTGCDSLTGSSNITYRIDGAISTRVDITYESGGGTSQLSNVMTPWSYSLKAQSGDFLYVSAQIVSGSGPITVTINDGGTVLWTGHASGFASIATASGSLD